MLKTCTIHVILNKSSGFDEKDDAAEVLERVLTARGFAVHVRTAAKGEDLSELTREMARAGADIVIAGGGDGTINAVASALAGTGVTLGIVPLGTINHLARDLKIPFDLEEAANVIADGHVIRIDLGEVNGRHFINNAIIGLYPMYRFQRDKREKRGRYKLLAMLSAVWTVFRRNPALRVRVDVEGTAITQTTPFLMIANNSHEMEGYNLGKRASLDAGALWVYVMHRMSRVGLLRLAVSVLLGRFSKWQDFDVLNAPEITVESRHKTIGVSLDGEVVRLNPPLQYRSMPQALRVIVPASYARS